jgi:hypothetical protein
MDVMPPVGFRLVLKKLRIVDKDDRLVNNQPRRRASLLAVTA